MRLPVIREDADPWYADGLSFTCTQCGDCCTGGPGYVWISTVEIDRLADFLKLSRKETIRQYCRRLGGRYSLNEVRTRAGSYDCVFLKEIPLQRKQDGQTVTFKKRICEIYNVRPLQCRTWPFWEGLLASPENWAFAAEKCPGMNKGRAYAKEQIEALRDSPDWPEKGEGPSSEPA